MRRNRRNTRRITSIKEILNMKTFLTIVSILIIVIIGCIGVNYYKRYQDKMLLAKQKEEIQKQSEEIFCSINDRIDQTNQSISESDVIIKMAAVGDILCGEEMLRDGYNNETEKYDFSHMFSNISGYIKNADIVMGTMETGIANKEYNDENAPIEFAEAVKNSGVNFVTIAHNHSLDNGVDGIKETKDNLKKIGFDVVGDKIEQSNAVIIKETKNTKIAYLTYTCFMNNETQRTKNELDCINMYSNKQAKEDIEYARKKGAEFICVMIHWGDPMSERVTNEQKEIADFLVDNGVNIIIGSHPSVVQPMEVKQNKDGDNVFIAYSIGTYISTLYSEESKTELILNIELRKNGKDGKVYLNKVNYVPIYMLDKGSEEENRFCLIDMKQVATYYSEGNKEVITREVYDKLIEGLNRLNKILEK